MPTPDTKAKIIPFKRKEDKPVTRHRPLSSEITKTIHILINQCLNENTNKRKLDSHTPKTKVIPFKRKEDKPVTRREPLPDNIKKTIHILINQCMQED